MPRKPTDHHFAADLPAELWKQFDDWSKGRGKLSNPQIGAAWLKLFLVTPEWMKVLALAGRLDQPLGDLTVEIFGDLIKAVIRKAEQAVMESAPAVVAETPVEEVPAKKEDALRIVKLMEPIPIETPEDSAAWAGLAKQAGVSGEEIGRRMAEHARQIQQARARKKARTG